jgi:hypothetical protein
MVRLQEKEMKLAAEAAQHSRPTRSTVWESVVARFATAVDRGALERLSVGTRSRRSQRPRLIARAARRVSSHS